MSADQLALSPPPIDDNLGPGAVRICTPILVFGIILYIIRIVTRVTPTYQLNITDYAISGAVLFEVLSYSFYICTIRYGMGRHSNFVSPEDTAQVIRWIFGVQVTSNAGVFLARASIPLLLLRFRTDSRAWKITIWISVTVQFMAFAANEVWDFAACQPARAMWEEVVGAHCAAPLAGWVVGYTTNGVALICDMLYAIMPMFAITKLGRSAVERGLMCFLMALCMAATVSNAMRIYYMEYYDYSASDFLRSMFTMAFWCRIEEYTLLAAASAPFMKPAIERVLRRFKFPTFNNIIRSLNTYHSTQEVVPERISRWYPLKSLKSRERGAGSGQSVDKRKPDSDNNTAECSAQNLQVA